MTMARQAWETIVAYKFVWLRMFGYFAVPTWLMWETVTKDLTGALWATMDSFERFQIIGKCVAAGFIAFMGFLDQSLGRARDDLRDVKRANGGTPTQIIYKEAADLMK